MKDIWYIGEYPDIPRICKGKLHRVKNYINDDDLPFSMAIIKTQDKLIHIDITETFPSKEKAIKAYEHRIEKYNSMINKMQKYIRRLK